VKDESQTVQGGWSATVVRFNASVSAQEGRHQDEALPKDEVDASISSWLHEKEA
jgi:hypothetical protein